LTELGGLFWIFFKKTFMGATSKGLFWTLFGPFFVWAHLRDLFEDFLDTLQNFWEHFFFLEHI
jgi:hypothetical protein